MAVGFCDFIERLRKTESRLERAADGEKRIFKLFVELCQTLVLEEAQVEARRRKGNDEPDCSEKENLCSGERSGEGGERDSKERAESGKCKTQIKNFLRRHLKQNVVVLHGGLLNIPLFVAVGGFGDEVDDDNGRAGDGERGAEACDQSQICQQFHQRSSPFSIPRVKISRSSLSPARLMSSMNEGRLPEGTWRPVILPLASQPS